jgi:hypothetical protein
MDSLVDPKSFVAINAFVSLASLCSRSRPENGYGAPWDLFEWLDPNDFISSHHTIIMGANATMVPLREMLSQRLHSETGC